MSDRPFIVMLLKGPDREPREWRHTNARDALRRARALAELHQVEVEDHDYLLIVDGSAWYADKEAS